MTNHHNYSRWVLLFYLDLAHLATENPDLENILTNVGFSVKRTEKPFAGVRVDMALEQTNVKSLQKELWCLQIYASTAVNRWIGTSFLKTRILKAVFDYTDVNGNFNESKEIFRQGSKKKDKQGPKRTDKINNNSISKGC